MGRFLTRDTYLDEHPYLYCEHDPVNATDPSGHDPEDPWWEWIKKQAQKKWVELVLLSQGRVKKVKEGPAPPQTRIERRVKPPDPPKLPPNLKGPGGGGGLNSPFPGFIIAPKGFWDDPVGFIHRILFPGVPEA